MDESPCYISQRPVASSQETNQGKSTQKNLPNKAIETHHMPGPPPGFINTFGAKVIHGDKMAPTGGASLWQPREVI